jgi:hypothetical protein
MSDRPEEGFLPPEPAGPEPELGQRPTPAQPLDQQPTQWQQPAPADPQGASGQWQQPPAGAPGGWQQPPPASGWRPPPPSWAQPPPGWQPPPQQAWAPTPSPQWAYPQEPENNQAITGFVLAMVSLGLWLMSAGFSSFVSIGLAIGGLITSRRAKRKLEAGEIRKHRGLAQAGFIISIVMIALATLSTIAWIAFFLVFATDEQFRHDLEDDDGNGLGDSSISTTVRLGALAVRVGATLLS